MSELGFDNDIKVHVPANLISVVFDEEHDTVIFRVHRERASRHRPGEWRKGKWWLTLEVTDDKT